MARRGRGEHCQKRRHDRTVGKRRCFRGDGASIGLVLDDTLQIHTLELGRYNLAESELETASAEDCWLYWFLYADQYGPEELLKLFPEEAFQTATRAIIQIAEKTEDKAMYDAREKANRDFQTAISSAHQEGEVKGRQEGEVKGRQEGEVKGRQEGRQVGRQEGTLIGRVETFQELLGITEPTREELSNFDIPQLTELADRLQRQLRSRGN